MLVRSFHSVENCNVPEVAVESAGLHVSLQEHSVVCPTFQIRAATIYFAMYFATDMTKVNRKIKEAPSVLTLAPYRKVLSLAWHTYRPFELHRGAWVWYTTDLPDR